MHSNDYFYSLYVVCCSVIFSKFSGQLILKLLKRLTKTFSRRKALRLICLILPAIFSSENRCCSKPFHYSYIAYRLSLSSVSLQIASYIWKLDLKCCIKKNIICKVTAQDKEIYTWKTNYLFRNSMVYENCWWWFSKALSICIMKNLVMLNINNGIMRNFCLYSKAAWMMLEKKLAFDLPFVSNTEQVAQGA